MSIAIITNYLAITITVITMPTEVNVAVPVALAIIASFMLVAHILSIAFLGFC